MRGSNLKGKKNKNHGKLFEKNIQESIKPQTFLYRLRDSSAAWSYDKEKKSRFTTTNWCDFIIYSNKSLYMVEAKTVKGKSLPFSNITQSQTDGFEKLKKYNTIGVHGVFMVEFRQTGKTYAVNSKDVLKYMKLSDKGELPREYKSNTRSLPVGFLKEKGVLVKIQEGKIKRLEIEEALDGLAGGSNV